MKILAVVVCMVLVLGGYCWAEDEIALKDVRSALQNKQFGDAVELAESLMAESDENHDFLTYLKGLALLHNKDYEKAIEACDIVINHHETSPWRRKAVFLKAQCHIRLKQFQEAEKIYDSEARRLLSAARKEEIAGVYFRFAEAMSRKPEKGELDLPPPDYRKAHELYSRTLTLEIGGEMKDETMFRLGRMMHLAQDYGQAVNHYRQYLNEFDSQWMGAVDSPRRQGSEGARERGSEGKHVREARYHIAQCQVAQDQMRWARMNLEDLLKMIMHLSDKASEKLVRDSRFLMIKTYHIPKPQNNEELDLGVKAVRAFLNDFPGEARGMRLSFQIGASYQNRGRSEEAIAAYQDFLKAEYYEPSYDEEKDQKGESHGELYQKLRMSATYRIGEILFQQKDYPEAMKIWSQYVGQFPNGPQWTNAQQGIVNAEFQTGVDLLSDEKYEEAVKAWDEFLEKHPLDGRSRQIMFVYGQLHYYEAEKAGERGGEGARERGSEEYRKAVSEWDKLVNKYPNTEESSLALFRIGGIYEEKLGDLEKALESYRKLAWGSWHDDAQRRIQDMTNKKLELVTERVFRTNEPAKVKVTLRNIEKLTVSVYKVDLEAYWRKMHGIKGVEKLDIALIAPDSSWEYSVTDYGKYKLFEREIEIPIEQAGVYVVNLGEEDLEATTLVVRSDIDAIIKTSRKEVLVFAQDMLANKPASGAKVLVSDGSKVIGQGETGADGVFHGKLSGLKDTAKATVFVVKNGSVASDLVDMSGLGLSAGLTRRGYIYTDRPAYRPGGRVSIKGIIRDVKDGSYSVIPDAVYEISVLDSQGRLLRSEEVKLSQFGTFHTEMLLDEDASVGEYRITVQDADDRVFTGSFRVERYQLEKMKLALEFDKRVYFRGEKVEATFTASYYYGQPVSGKPIRYVLPDGRQFTEETDSDGKLKIVFDTAPMQPDSTLMFHGTIEGENVQVRDAALLARLGFSISLKPSAETVISGEPFDVFITSTGADGKPVGKELILTVYQQMEVSRHPILSRVPWLRRDKKPSGEVKVSEHKISTDDKTGKGTIHLSLENGGRYILRASGKDRFDQPVSSETKIFISDDKDAIKLRIFSDRAKLKVGEDERIRIHSRLKSSLALVTFEGEGIISHRVVELGTGWNDVDFSVGNEHFPNFHISVSVMDGQKLRTAGKDFTVERELVVSLKLDDTYQPGQEAEVEITATDQLGNPVSAELSLALVDEALYAIYPDNLTRITDFFNEGIHRDAAMRTASSCAFRYRATTQKVLKELLEEEKRLEIVNRDAGRYDKLVTELGDIVYTPEASASVEELAMFKVEKAQSKSRVSRRRGRAAGGRELALKDKKADYFYADANGVLTEEFGVAGKAGFSWGRAGQEIAVREEFADAGHWLPTIVTDASGRATAKIPMPEKTTQWRLTARGCTVETLVGQTTAKTITRKEFFLDIKLPSILTEGDKIRVLARVHNLTESTGTAKLRLKLSIDGETRTSEQSVKLKKNGTAEVIFDEMEIQAGREARVEVMAVAGKMTDGVSRTIPIRPWGMEYADGAGGISSGNETIFLQLPGNRKYNSKRLTLSIGPNVNRLIFDLAMNTITPREIAFSKHIAPMPGDAGSDLLAAAYALKYLEQTGGDPVDNKRLLSYTRGLVARLVVSQRDDGGWSWSRGSAGSDIYVSSRNLWALAEARRQGITVHSQTMEKAASYLKEAFARAAQNDNEAKSVILHSLSRVGAADFAYANRLYRDRNRLNAPALAYTALVFANLDRNEIGGEMLDVLQGKMKGASDRATTLFKREKTRAVGDVETVALTLLALESIRPNSPLVQQIVENLLSRRTFRGYSPHKAKGPVVAALATYYGKTQFAVSDYRLEITVNGKDVEKMEVRGRQPTMLIHVPTKYIKAGKNRIEFHLAGRGSYTYTATLSGFSPELNDPKSWDRPHVRSRKYYHAPLEYKGRQIASSTSQITQLEEGQRTYVTVDIREGSRDRYIIVHEYLPAGAMLVDGSISGDFQHYEIGDGIITFYYPPGTYMRDYQYQLVSYAPGTYKALPTVIQDTMRPGDMRMGKATTLTVLAPGEKSIDKYKMNYGELYGMGKAYFDDGIYDQAKSYLSKLYERNPTYQQREAARMLLWIYTEDIYYDSEKVVQYFEALRERFPELYIPFNKILVVGKAYRDMEEYERAYLIYKATIDASFVNDSNVSAVLEDEGQFLSSIDFQENLWREYPDSPQVTSSYFALSQAVYSKVPEAAELNRIERNISLLKGQSESKPEKITRLDLLKETVIMLSEFLTLYPDDPLADDAAFSLANALLDLEDFPHVVTLCQTAQKRYPRSEYMTSFQYVEALGYFSQRKYDEAVNAATIVADGKSKDRDLSRYILGQIYHARGKPDMAIDWYGKVKGIYPDAQESISYFQEKRVSLDEVKVVRPEEDAKIIIKYRNIKEVAVQVYRVDLMKLYLREKDLSKIRSVQLAGISPQFSKTIMLGDGKDYVDKEHEMSLELEGEGAYLVICRGDDLFSSGLVLITP